MTSDDLSDRLREDADDVEWDGYEVQAVKAEARSRFTNTELAEESDTEGGGE